MRQARRRENNRSSFGDDRHGDEVMAAALIDRLVHHCHIVTIRGNSYRMRQHTDLWRALHTTQDPQPAPGVMTETILRRRYTRGDIDREEFDRRLMDIRKWADRRAGHAQGWLQGRSGKPLTLPDR